VKYCPHSAPGMESRVKGQLQLHPDDVKTNCLPVTNCNFFWH
jgi:hypothetical protein